MVAFKDKVLVVNVLNMLLQMLSKFELLITPWLLAREFTFVNLDTRYEQFELHGALSALSDFHFL